MGMRRMWRTSQPPLFRDALTRSAPEADTSRGRRLKQTNHNRKKEGYLLDKYCPTIKISTEKYKNKGKEKDKYSREPALPEKKSL
jgi:hypothetical protein